MKIKIEIKNGQPIFTDRESFQSLKDGIYTVDIRNMDMRTIQQNRALHMYFNFVKDALLNNGITVKAAIKPEIPFDMDSVKNFMWRPIQKAVLGKASTTRLSRKDIDSVYEVMNKLLGERYGIHIPFPSITR